MCTESGMAIQLFLLSSVITSVMSLTSWHVITHKQCVYPVLAISINIISRKNINTKTNITIETIFHIYSQSNKIEYLHYLNKMMKWFIDYECLE